VTISAEVGVDRWSKALTSAPPSPTIYSNITISWKLHDLEYLDVRLVRVRDIMTRIKIIRVANIGRIGDVLYTANDTTEQPLLERRIATHMPMLQRNTGKLLSCTG